jgi:hypothetical protein
LFSKNWPQLWHIDKMIGLCQADQEIEPIALVTSFKILID